MDPAGILVNRQSYFYLNHINEINNI